MELAVGEILEGKVTGITKFGAFVSLPGGKSGMVHISEIAHAYVSDISEHLAVGQTVQVKVIKIDPAGKINLSIKQCTEAPKRADNRSGGQRRGGYSRPAGARAGTTAGKEPQSFDDMLKQFMADSDSKLSSVRQYSDHRTKSKRRQ